MTNKRATVGSLYVVLAAVVLLGSGCTAFRKENGVPPASPSSTSPVTVASSTEDALDTSDWVTYGDPKLGFEMNHPKEWLKKGTIYGTGTDTEFRPFWKDGLGTAFWSSDEVNFTVQVKRSDLSLQHFNQEDKGDFLDENPVDMNGSSVLRQYSPLHQTGSGGNIEYQVHDLILMKSGDAFYKLDMSIVSQFRAQAERIEREWTTVLKNFKPMSIQ